MAAQSIKVDVPGAQGTYSAAASDLAANRAVVGADGVRAGFGATLAGLSTTSNANLDAAAALNGQGSQFANGFDAADKDGAAKAGAAGPKGPGDPSNPAGAPKVPGADKFSSRLTPSDLLKMAAHALEARGVEPVQGAEGNGIGPPGAGPLEEFSVFHSRLGVGH